MAGAGYKLFSTGEVLTAANVNTYLMQQTVMVFASAAARTTALSGVVAEGMISYRSDSKVLEIYNGTSWVDFSGDITGVTTAANSGLAGGATSGTVALTLATTAKGDLLVGTGSGTAAVLPIGTTNQTLVVDSSTTTGVKWSTLSTSPLTTKGDVYTRSASADARLAIGTDGQELVADSSQTTGLRWSDRISAAGKNAIINGGMDIWQRGTSVALAASTSAGSAFTADRWQYPTGVNQACTVSRQLTNDTTNLPNIQYCARVQRNSGQTGTAAINFGMNIETSNSIPFAGKTIVFSLYARAGANYSATSNALGINLVYGTGTDQSVWSGLTGQTNIINQTATLTTTWQRFSYSVAVPATATQLALYIQNSPTGTAGVNDYYEITGVQLELGSSATPFSRAGGTIQGELAACQRYYERISPNSQNSSMAGFNNSTTVGYFTIPFKVTKRVNPTITLGSVTTDWGVRLPGGTNAQLSAYSVIGNTLDNAWLSGTATGLTSGNGNFLVNVGNNGYIEMSAEL